MNKGNAGIANAIPFCFRDIFMVCYGIKYKKGVIDMKFIKDTIQFIAYGVAVAVGYVGGLTLVSKFVNKEEEDK